ncbi:MAG: efflux RND transporter periplasmic adaptor subunit [Bacteroidales bacterium]|nr:efflux RND transporter periplasmic adaptor subunit [Bacteroidales bacterium]
MKTLKIVILVVLILGFVVYRSFKKVPRTSYITVFAERRDIAEIIYIPGNVFPVREIEIKSQLSGILEEIFVVIGDFVKEGTAIASVKLVPSTSDIERLESAVSQTRIEFNARNAEYLRNKQLFNSRTIAQTEMDESTRLYLMAKENFISAQNQLDILKKGRVLSKNISNIVKTSTSGTVIDIPLEAGASVIERNNYNPGTTVAVVAETRRFKFKTLIAEQYLRHVCLNDSVTLTFNAYPNLKTQAVVTKISSKGEAENGIMKYILDAEFEITDTMPVLRSGYSATASIILNSSAKTLSIEEKHINYHNDSTFVRVLDTIRKTAICKKVDLGVSDGIYTEIKNGVTEAERIITNYAQIKSNP